LGAGGPGTRAGAGLGAGAAGVRNQAQGGGQGRLRQRRPPPRPGPVQDHRQRRQGPGGQERGQGGGLRLPRDHPGEARGPRHKLERHYDQAAARDEGELKPLAFEGKTVLITEKDGQYGFKVKDGAELAGDDAAPLEREFNKDKDDKAGLDKLLMPQKAVKVGETWKVPVEILIKIFAKKGGTEFDADKASGTGKLLRVYKHGGKQFGVFDFHVELPLKAIEMEKKQYKTEAGSKVTFMITQDACIDGSDAGYTMTIAFHIHSVAAVPDADNPQGRVTLDLRHSGSKTLREVAD